jgi:HlyD family secretion protein
LPQKGARIRPKRRKRAWRYGAAEDFRPALDVLCLLAAKNPMNTKTVLVAAGVGVVIAGALAWAFRPQPIPVDLAPVARGPLVVTIDEEGRTRIRERYVVSTPLAGRLLRVSLRPGDKVEAGQTVIAVIEPATPELLDPRSRALAEAKIKAAEAAQQRSAQMLERARTSHEYAATELQRAQALFERAGLSHRELDAAEQREGETAAELRSAEFESRVAAYEFEMARAAFVGEDSATAEFAGNRRMEIHAPISGRVLRVFQESATVVPAGSRLVEVGDPGDLEVVVETLSTDAV